MLGQTHIQTVRKFLGKNKRRLERQQESLERSVRRVVATPLSGLAGGPAEGICFLTEKMAFTPERLILGYLQGMFPLGNGNGKVEWHDPDPRGTIPVEDFRVPRTVRRLMNKGKFDIRFNTRFRDVIAACAARKTVWLSPPLIEAYVRLHEMGIAHSIEAWQEGELVGGLYGVAIGSFFSGESMFYTVDDAGNVAFAHLLDHLKARGFLLHDCQYLSRHVQRFGACEISRDEYKGRLARALVTPASFV